MLCVELQNNLLALATEQNSRYKLVQESSKTLKFVGVISREFGFLHESGVSLANFVLYLCLAIDCGFFNPWFLLCFHIWVCSLLNFYLFCFQGLSARQKEIKMIQVGRMKTKLRISFIELF